MTAQWTAAIVAPLSATLVLLVAGVREWPIPALYALLVTLIARSRRWT